MCHTINAVCSYLYHTVIIAQYTGMNINFTTGGEFPPHLQTKITKLASNCICNRAHAHRSHNHKIISAGKDNDKQVLYKES